MRIAKDKQCSFIKICLIIIFIFLGGSACKKEAGNPNNNEKRDSTIKKERKTKNLIVVTLDGYRWQEVFRGADSSIFFSGEFTSQDMQILKERFWDAAGKKRREKLMPFLWNEIAKQGKLYGNRDLGCKINVKNPYWVSYPGYNEIWTGFPDPDINSNDYGDNPNYNLLEVVNTQTDFKNKVAVFTTWKKFWEILNHKRSKLYQVSGEDSLKTYLHDPEVAGIMDDLNSNLNLYTYNSNDSKDDQIAYAVAKSYLKKNHPRMLYVAFGHTDDQAHAGHYDFYLEEGHNIDAMISDLWNYIQNDPFYKDSTTLFITCDHGRGIGNDWKNHGATHPHSDETWCALIGPDTKPLGEINKSIQFYQNQYAMSLSAFLGINFANSTNKPVGTPIKEFMDNN